MIPVAARGLTKAERNYSTTRKELLALVWGSEHFETYFYGDAFSPELITMPYSG